MAKKPANSKAPAKKTSEKPEQQNLADSDGEITAHERFKDVDRIASKMFEARDEVAAWEETRKNKFKEMHEKLVEHGHEGAYFVNYGSEKFRIEVKTNEKLTITKVKEKKDAAPTPVTS